MQAIRATAALLLLCGTAFAASGATGERTARFDADPGWEGRNNRSAGPPPREVRQDFGYAATSHLGGEPGEIGGFVNPAAEAAYYAKPIGPRSLETPLFASGRLTVTGPHLHVLVGFFNRGTVHEWRTPNTIALRLLGRGDHFFAFVEYATSKWRAGGDSPGGFATVQDPKTGRRQLRGFKSDGAVHTWSLTYDPSANSGAGAITATIDGETSVCNVSPGHRADGAVFDRFGLLNVMKQWDNGGEVWLDRLNVLGAPERLDRDPRWDGHGNHARYVTTDVRPRFDFGFTPTHYAGGRASGEIGGRVYRGDCRYPERMACYGDRVGPLSLQRPLTAAGRICLRRGVSDSTTLIGFYHSVESLRRTDSQSESLPADFLGAMIEGPSREGFLLQPACRIGTGRGQTGKVDGAPHIYPDGRSHAWRMEYRPATDSGPGELRVWLDDRSTVIRIEPASTPGAGFDRFGIVTTWIDGNVQEIYFDDLTFTCQ